MSSTSKKHLDFVSEPMGNKCVSEVAGIGAAAKEKFKNKKIEKAYVLLGAYLTFDKNEDEFKRWLKEMGGLNEKFATDCAKCIAEWCNSFL